MGKASGHLFDDICKGVGQGWGFINMYFRKGEEENKYLKGLVRPLVGNLAWGSWSVLIEPAKVSWATRRV